MRAIYGYQQPWRANVRKARWLELLKNPGFVPGLNLVLLLAPQNVRRPKDMMLILKGTTRQYLH
jgi:hypothetical protein